jgi:hypothetical protein
MGGRSLGLKLHPQNETEAIANDLQIGKHPLKPLLEGKWE